MKIKRLEIDGFRCLVNFEINFEDDLTVIVGENDSGKTSLIECLKIITQNKPIEADDFTHGKDTILLVIEIDNFIFERKYKKTDGLISEELFVARPTWEYISSIRNTFESKDFDISHEENSELIKNTAKTFGFNVRSNSNIDNLRASIP